MWHDVATTALGVVFGLLSGFYFERRNTKSTREHNAELERDLASLRNSIYSVGGTTDRISRPAASTEDSLVADVHQRARNTQGPDGRASRTQLTSHFLAQGRSAQDVDAAISALCERGQLDTDGKWLVVK